MIKKSTTKTIINIGLLLFVGYAFLSFFSTGEVTQTKEDDTSAIRMALAEEFKGAYALDIAEGKSIIEIDMVASEGEIEIFDGYKTKIWSYNGTVPGPEIRLQLGEKLRINFANELPEETTVHFHGIRVPNAMDGVPGVTQDPIKSGNSFLYEFTPKDAGTYWFHPHVNTAEQMERGLYGTIIVEDKVAKEYSQDVVWVIDDWRVTGDYQIDPRFVTQGDLMHDGRWGNVVTVNGTVEEVLKVQPGERIRLRIVNTSNARIYQMNFDGLNAQVIAVDGLYTKRNFNGAGFELSPGNRIDVDITIPADADGKTFTLKDSFTRNTIELGKIEVSGQSVLMPSFNYPSNQNIPDWDNASGVEVDEEYRLNARRGPNGIEWTINERAFPDYDPMNFKFGEFNKISFVNESSRLHPMHLHGMFFKVLTRNGVKVDEPYFRDTVLLHPRETVEVGLVPLDKGEWVSHCHILEHAEAGMLTVISVE